MLSNIKILIYLCLYLNVESQPIIIKTGVAKNHEQHGTGGLQDLSAKKGISSYASDQGFKKNGEGQYVSSEDSGQYVQQLADNKQHIKESAFNDEKFRKEGGESIENIGKKAGHKKGHHKSGFRNSYHKEENGSQSSYYDDSDDQGGEYLLNKKHGAYSDDSSSKNSGSYLDGSKYLNDNSRSGAYNNEGLYHKDLGNAQNYDQRKYLDDRGIHGHSDEGNRFGESGQYIAQNYHASPHGYINSDHYYPEDPYYADYSAPKRTITVYEDPRVYDYEDYPEYYRNGDSVGLLVKRPIDRRYYEDDNIYRHGYY